MSRSSLPVLTVLLVVTFSNFRPVQAGEQRRRELGEALARVVFPKDKVIRVLVASMDEGVRSTAMTAMETHFDYARIVSVTAREYASALTEDDLVKAIAFFKTTAGSTSQSVTERLPSALRPVERPETPPVDTEKTRLEQATKMASLAMHEELFIETLEMLLADAPEADRNARIAEVRSVFRDPSQLARVQREYARQYVPVLTTNELKQVVAFYSSSTGQKLLRANPRIGKVAMETAAEEGLRVSERYMDEQTDYLRRTIERSR